MSKFIAFVTAALAALTTLTARLRGAVVPVPVPADLDPYVGYEPTEADLAWGATGCPWECGECRYCRQDRDPDQG